jgi:hypothetical protein
MSQNFILSTASHAYRLSGSCGYDLYITAVSNAISLPVYTGLFIVLLTSFRVSSLIQSVLGPIADTTNDIKANKELRKKQ